MISIGSTSQYGGVSYNLKLLNSLQLTVGGGGGGQNIAKYAWYEKCLDFGVHVYMFLFHFIILR